MCIDLGINKCTDMPIHVSRHVHGYLHRPAHRDVHIDVINSGIGIVGKVGVSSANQKSTGRFSQSTVESTVDTESNDTA